MASNRLKLNAAKTQVMWLGTRQQLKKIVSAEITLQGHRIVPSTSVVCLGVHIDPELTFALVAARCFYHLRQQWTIRRTLSDDNARMLVHALTSNRVYCNIILHCVAAVCSASVPVRSERRCTADRQKAEVRPHYADFT